MMSCWDVLPPVFTQADEVSLGASLSSGDFYILKMHGTIDRPETMILGRKDYQDAMYNNPALQEHLKTLFNTKTVLFVGFSMTDPDLMTVLDELSAVFRGGLARRHALMKSDEISRKDTERIGRVLATDLHGLARIFLQFSCVICVHILLEEWSMCKTRRKQR